MTTKLSLLLIFLTTVFASCQKAVQEKSTELKKTELDFIPIKGNYQDTVIRRTIAPDSGKIAAGLFSSPPIPSIVIDYKGNGSYYIVALCSNNGDKFNCNYSFFKGSVQIPFTFSSAYSTIINDYESGYGFNYSPTPGDYFVRIHYNNGPLAGADANVKFTIYAQPITPTGKLAIYRYYNPKQGHHFMTTNWEELASGGAGFIFEKVQGYLYPNSNSASNISPFYRFYYPPNGDHLYQTGTTAPTGYNLEGITGYISTIPSGNFITPLNRYYNSTSHDHLYATSPEDPTSAGYHLEGVTGYVQTP
jgi:hypothetical protein